MTSGRGFLSRVIASLAVGVLTTCSALANDVKKGAPVAPSAQARVAQVVVEYEPASSAAAERGLLKLKEWHYLEDAAVGIDETIRLPKPLLLVGTSCEEPNALYLPDQRAVVICYELVDYLVTKASRATQAGSRKRLPQESREPLAIGAITFILLHEVGHALIHLLDLPITGREEDVADQIATFLTLRELKDPETFNVVSWVVVGGAWFFDTLSRDRTTVSLAQQHGLDLQRRFNVMCWTYGAHPREFASLAASFQGASDRLLGCPEESAQMRRSLTRLLGKHLKPTK